MPEIINVEQALTQRINQADVPAQPQQKASALHSKVAWANTQYLHGPSGTLNLPGIDPDVFSTIYRPRGLSPFIPTLMSRFVNPIYKTLTAQPTDTGSEPATVCDRPPYPGDLTAAALTAPFGLFKRSTKTFSMDRVGEITNRAEPLDMTLVNTPGVKSSFVPEVARNMDLSDEKRMQFWQLGLSLERLLEGLAFTGAGANQGNAGAGYREFYGLQTLVNTGHVDVQTNSAVAALNSTLINWNNTISATQSILGASQDLLTLFSRLYKFLYMKADSLNLSPVQFALVMPPDAFWELTAIWPCSYLTNGCASTTANVQVVQGHEQIAMRDDMRNGSFLWINGRKELVILTDAVAETAVATGVKADFYILPLQAGGRSVLYWEAFDFANPLDASVMADLPQGTYSVTDGGKYIWTHERTSFCVYYEVMMRPRLVLRTPFLAARVQNVAYPSVLHSFNAYPSSIYYQPTGGAAAGSLYGGINFPTAV